MATASNPYDETGGLRWHVRALRQQREWAQFVAWVAGVWEQRELTVHNPSTPKKEGNIHPLLLLGPSAGWTLPAPLLAGFDPLIAVDVDPFAPLLFRTRFRGGLKNRTLIWLKQDFMQHLPDLLNRWPDAIVMFANCLGQQGLLHDSSETAESGIDRLTVLLTGRRWFSYHDRLSFTLTRPMTPGTAEAIRASLESLQPAQCLDSAVLAGRILPLLPSPPPAGFSDHLTTRLLPPGVLRRYALLPVTSRQIHVVEAGWGH